MIAPSPSRDRSHLTRALIVLVSLAATVVIASGSWGLFAGWKRGWGWKLGSAFHISALVGAGFTALLLIVAHICHLIISRPGQSQSGSLISDNSGSKKQPQGEVSGPSPRDVREEKLTSFVVHEITNPLSLISVSAELLAAEPSNDEKTRRYAQHIKGAAQDANRVLQDLRAMAAPVNPTTPLCINRLVEEVAQELELLGSEHNVQIQLRLSAVPEIMGDPFRLKQVLSNLIRNAVEASEEHVQTHRSQTSTIPAIVTVSTRVGRNDDVSVLVHNRGKTIPKDLRNELFEPYYTTKNQGIGLGLPICAHIVEKGHGGRIHIRSGERLGTVFTVTLPGVRVGLPVIDSLPTHH